MLLESMLVQPGISKENRLKQVNIVINANWGNLLCHVFSEEFMPRKSKEAVCFI